MTAGIVDQNLTHKLGCDSKKMGTVLPLGQVLLSQSHVRFVNQCGALKSVVGTFPLKIAVGDPVEFAVDERHQRVERGLISVTPTHK